MANATQPMIPWAWRRVSKDGPELELEELPELLELEPDPELEPSLSPSPSPPFPLPEFELEEADEEDEEEVDVELLVDEDPANGLSLEPPVALTRLSVVAPYWLC